MGGFTAPTLNAFTPSEPAATNEFRTPASEDALTLPELFESLSSTIFSELGTDLDGNTYTNREPMVSSLRRNLQSAMIDRLIGLSEPSNYMPRPIRTLAMSELRQLKDQIESVMEKQNTGQIDEYTIVHLTDLIVRIDRAINRVQISR